MKFLTFSILILFATASFAQVDTSFSFNRKGILEEFHLKKYSKSSQIKRYPVYAIEKSEVQDLQKLLTFFVATESEVSKLQKNRRELDSLHSAETAVYERNHKLQEKRVQNYDSAYQEMKKINGQLNDQLKNCEALAIKENKRNKRPSLFGLLGGLAVGVVIGILIN